MRIIFNTKTYLVLIALILIIFQADTYSQVDNSKTNALYEEKEVTFYNGSVKLVGSILTPKGKGSFPAVVIIHGSGGKINNRNHKGVTPFVKALVKRGIAVLYPDKRGQGKSEGSWHNASFVDLAEDAIAGVEVLHGTQKIDQKKIGIIGFSQGGIIAPIAASRSEKIAFVTNIAGSTVPMLEALIDEVEIASELNGLSLEQKKMVTEINRKGIQYAITGKGLNDYLIALNNAKKTELKNSPVVKEFPSEPNPSLIQFIRLIKDVDPIDYWKKVKVPALFIYGGRDRLIRSYKSIDRIEKIFGKSDFNYTIMLFSNEGHGTYREDLLDFMASWILEGIKI